MAKSLSRSHGRQSIAFILEQGGKYRGDLLDGFRRADGDPEMAWFVAGDSMSQGTKGLAGLQLQTSKSQ
jgi:hypothetical protein